MNNIKIVSYKHKYLDSLLECWNDNLKYDPISKDRFLNTFVYDENFDENLLLLAIDNNQVRGFCFGIRRKSSYFTKGLEPTRGWIINMAVNKDYQRQGIGTRLYNELKKMYQDKGIKRITLNAFSPNYLTPGVDVRYEAGISFFKKMGYPINVDAVSMYQELLSFEFTEEMKSREQKLSEEGIHIVNYKDEYYSELMSFLKEEFEPGWSRNVIMALQKNEAEKTIILALDEHQNVLGYCMRKIDGNDERFGPIGVKESIRSKGLGGVLFDRMMFEMQSHGVKLTYFLWTSGAAIRFYERHGMKIYRTYKVMSKEI